MKEKIMNIKNILKIIISLFIIFNCVKSCSKATMTSETLMNMRDNLYILQEKGLLSQDFMQNFNFSNETWGTEYIILITNESVDNVYIAYGYNGTKIINRDTIDWKTNGTTVTNVGCKQYKNKNSNNNGISSTRWGGFPGNSYTYVYAYSPYYEIDTTALTLNAGEEYGGNYINHGLQFSTGTKTVNIIYGNTTLQNVIQTEYLKVAKAIWGIIENYNEINTLELSMKLYQILPNGTEKDLGEPLREFMYLGHYYVYNDPVTVEYNKLYKLDITYEGDTTTYYYWTVPINETVATGTTITYNWNSGDTQWTIQDQMQQEEKQNTFWENAYNSLFVVDSGDIQQVVDNFMSSANLEQYGDISGELMILNTLRGTPTDFIISWEPIQWQRKNNNTKWRYKL